MKPRTFNRGEKKVEKLTKMEKVYNAVQKMKKRAEAAAKQAK